MRILLIRHAESQNNLILGLSPAEYQAARTPDPGLSEKGKLQSERLGLFLMRKKLKIKKMFCSALVRSIHTASILQRILNIDLEIWVPIHETGGIYMESVVVGAGKGRQWIKENFPGIGIPSEITDEGWWLRDTKEMRPEAIARAHKLVEEFKKWAIEGKYGPEDCIALVTHGGIMDLLMGVLFDRKEDSKVRITHSNTGMTAIDFFENGSYQVKYMNTAEHLDDEFMMIGKDPAKTSNAVDYELDALTEPRPRSESQGFDLSKEVENLKVNNKPDLNLKTNEETNEPGYMKRETYDQDDEELEKKKEELGK